MWDKFVNKVKNELKSDDEKSFSMFHEIVEQEYHVEYSDMWKLNINQLTEIIKKYDGCVVNIKKKQKQNIQELETLQIKSKETDKKFKDLLEEREQQNQTLQEIQKHLNLEMIKSISLNQDLELSKNQNQHLKQQLQQYENNMPNQRHAKKYDDFDSKTRISMSADSQLLIFTNEQELQSLRDLFDLVQMDAEVLLQKIKKDNNGELPQKVQLQVNEQGEEEEIIYTLDDLMSNIWDSVNQFNDNFEFLKQKMVKYEKDKNSIQQNQNSAVNQLNQDIEKLQNTLREEVKQKKQIQTAKEQLEKDLVSMNEQYNRDKEARFKEIFDQNTKLQNQNTSMKQQFDIDLEKNKQEINNLVKQLEIRQKVIDSHDQDKHEYEQNFFLKTKEIENKSIQEKLKIDQLIKENTKLEEKYQKVKQDISQQIEIHDKDQARIKNLEEKRIEEKKKLKQQKIKIEDLTTKIKQLQDKYQQESSIKDKQISDMKYQINQLNEKFDIKNEVQRQTLDKEMKINTLEIMLENSNSDIQNINTEKNNIEIKYEQVLNENKLNLNTIKILKEKREHALAEIKRLTLQINMMKNSQNPSSFQKIQEISSMIEKAEKMNISQNSNDLYYQQQIDQSQSVTNQRPKQLDELNSKHFDEISLPVRSSRQEENGIKINTKSFQLKELKCLQMNKKDLEQLYKDFINTLLTIQDNQSLLKFERKFMDQIKKTQEYMDILEDQL